MRDKRLFVVAMWHVIDMNVSCLPTSVFFFSSLTQMFSHSLIAHWHVYALILRSALTAENLPKIYRWSIAAMSKTIGSVCHLSIFHHFCIQFDRNSFGILSLFFVLNSMRTKSLIELNVHFLWFGRRIFFKIYTGIIHEIRIKNVFCDKSEPHKVTTAYIEKLR